MKAGRGGRVESGADDGSMAGALRESDPLGLAAEWQRAGRKVALAMVETWGSSPCPAGSLLAVDDRGHFEGSVSGGCVEGAVIERAAAVLETGRAETLEFGIADETAWSVGLACGGRVRIYVERLEP
jgi:xanthine/CO dehydrogenase XdhC/CoxF family maturation factor